MSAADLVERFLCRDVHPVGSKIREELIAGDCLARCHGLTGKYYSDRTAVGVLPLEI